MTYKMRPPLLLLHCPRSIFPSPPTFRGACKNYSTKVTREYLPPKQLPPKQLPPREPPSVQITREYIVPKFIPPDQRPSVRVIREYLEPRAVSIYSATKSVRRVFAIPGSIATGDEARELDVISPVRQHVTPVRRLDYAPGGGVIERSFTPSGPSNPEKEEAAATPAIRKVVLGPPIRKNYSDLELRPSFLQGLQSLQGEGLARRVQYHATKPYSGQHAMTAPGFSKRMGESAAEKRVSRNSLSFEEHIVDLPEVKTTYVDTHCHLYTTLKMLQDGVQDETIPQGAINEFVKTVLPKQAVACVDIHCDLPLSDYHEKATALEWPEHFKYYFAIGAHPHVAMNYTDEVHDRLVAAMSNPSCVAWGECGLDYFKNSTFTHQTQRAVFQRQLAAAVALRKPIVVHTRDADADTLACLRETVPADHRLHIHCFTSGPNLARSLLEQYPNSFIGITGVVSYRGTEHVAQLVTEGTLPLERILLETDSPYMVPRSAYSWLASDRPELRKKRFVVSHSGMIPFTAEIVRGWVNQRKAALGEPEIGLDEVLDVTRRNAGRMYGIDV